MTGVGFVMSSKRFSSARASLSFLAFRILSARRWFSASSRACASFNSTHSFLRGEPHGAAVWVADVAVAHDFEPSCADKASASSSAAGVGLAALCGAEEVGLAASSVAGDVRLAASSGAEDVELVVLPGAKEPGLAASPALGDSPKLSAFEASLAVLADDTPASSASPAHPMSLAPHAVHDADGLRLCKDILC